MQWSKWLAADVNKGIQPGPITAVVVVVGLVKSGMWIGGAAFQEINSTNHANNYNGGLDVVGQGRRT